MLAFKCEEKVPLLMLRKDWLQFKQKQNSPGPNDPWFVGIEEQPFCPPQRWPLEETVSLFSLAPSSCVLSLLEPGEFRRPLRGLRLRTCDWISERASPWCLGHGWPCPSPGKSIPKGNFDPCGWSRLVSFLQGPKKRVVALYGTLSKGLGDFYVLLFMRYKGILTNLGWVLPSSCCR